MLLRKKQAGSYRAEDKVEVSSTARPLESAAGEFQGNVHLHSAKATSVLMKY